MSYNDINTNHNLKHYAYPSIEQFRNVIRNVKHKALYKGQTETGEAIYDPSVPLPTLKFIGSIKLHGTNSAVVFDIKNEIVYYQSRENVISPLKDNAGFATYMASKQPEIVEYVKRYFSVEPYSPTHKYDLMILFGEYCGGNIQKGVAINGLPKMFVLFDVKYINTETQAMEWLSKRHLERFYIHDLNIRNIYEFETYEIDIDFKNPELSQNQLIDMTIAVEDMCPVGKAFDKEGVGEGIVFKCISPGYDDNSGFWFKSKGEKHSNSKVKTIAAVDTEKIQNIKQFVENYVTDNRCWQSIDKLKEAHKPLTRSSLGDFIRWIHNDIIKEELDTILANGFEVKELGSPIANKAREWFFLNEIKFDVI